MPPAVRTCKLKEKENINSYLWSLKSSTSPPGGNLVDGLPPDCSIDFKKSMTFLSGNLLFSNSVQFAELEIEFDPSKISNS